MVRVSHKVKHRTNGDAVKRLANAFDKCASVDFGEARRAAWEGHRGGDHHEVEHFTKARPTQR